MESVSIGFWVFEVILLLGLLGIPFFVWKCKNKIKTFWKKSIFIVIAAICWGLLFFGHVIEPYRLVVREFSVPLEEGDPMKLVVVADFHARPLKGEWWVQKIVDQIQAIPDIDAVVIPGDFLLGTPEQYASVFKPLEDIEVPVLFTLGNHDHKLNNKSINSDLLAQSLRDFGLKDINNDSFFIASSERWISGIDDNYLGFDDISKIEQGKEIILLAHSPDIVDEPVQGYDPKLIISGHTHCGQIRLPWYGALPGVIPTLNGKKYERHLYEWKKDHWLFVTCGVGETGPAARLFNPPEIVILNIN